MSEVSPPEYTAVGESLEPVKLPTAKTHHLHFIERSENQEAIEQAISQFLEKDPSKYVSHDVSSFAVDKSTWIVTAVELQGGLKIKSVDNGLSFAEAAQKEGILVLGSGPNLSDGGCRLVYSLIHKAQLSTDPFKAVLSSDFYQLGEKRGSIYAFCCLRVANTQIPFEPGFQNRMTNHFYKCYASKTVSTVIYDNKAENSVYGKLVVAYNHPTFFALLGGTNLVAPSANLKDYFKILLEQNGLGFCLCMVDIKISRVVINLKEFLTCNGPIGEGLGAQTDMRTLSLQDLKCEEFIRNSDYARERGEIVVYLPHTLYDCALNRLGPSFFSKNCARGYGLEFLVTVECLNSKCSSIFRAFTSINVAIEEYKSTKPQMTRLTKLQDIVNIQSLPNTPLVVQSVRKSMQQRTKVYESSLLEHHTCSFLHDGTIMTISTISLSAKSYSGDKPSKLGFNSGEVPDYANALVCRRDGYSFGTSYYGRMLFKSRYLSLYDDFKALRGYGVNSDGFCVFLPKKKQVISGKTFQELYTLRISCPKKFHVGLKMISIEIVEKTIRKEGNRVLSDEKAQALVSSVFRAVGGKAFVNKYEYNEEQMVTVPDDVTLCVIPELAPSVVSETFCRDYFLIMKIKLSILSLQSVRLALVERIAVFNENHQDSLPPPRYYDEKEFTSSAKTGP